MGFNATFNNISVISWRSLLLMDETGVPGENHSPAIGMTWNIPKSKYFRFTKVY
jgi:hypothetical protein